MKFDHEAARFSFKKISTKKKLQNLARFRGKYIFTPTTVLWLGNIMDFDSKKKPFLSFFRGGYITYIKRKIIQN